MYVPRVLGCDLIGLHTDLAREDSIRVERILNPDIRILLLRTALELKCSSDACTSRDDRRASLDRRAVSEAIQPPMSPYMLAHPEAGPADLSWAKPLFCDVTVHLPYRDSQGKLAYTGSDGCYLGRDFKRNADYVYLPAQGRISSFTVTDWRAHSFTVQDDHVRHACRVP